MEANLIGERCLFVCVCVLDHFFFCDGGKMKGVSGVGGRKRKGGGSKEKRFYLG